MARGSNFSPPAWQRPDVLVAVGLGALLAWKLWSKPTASSPTTFSIAQGKDYEFTIEAHPYGDFDEWYSGVEQALEASQAHSLTLLSRSDGSVVLRFVKKSPVTATLPARMVLYPNDPPLATATVVDVKPASSGVIPLGESA